MSSRLPTRLPKMMIGFVVRRCTLVLGRTPTSAEFALWANAHGDPPNTVCLFGRPISEAEAAVILRHQARLVTARSAAPHEQHIEIDDLLQPRRATPSNVFSIEAARTRAEQGPASKQRSVGNLRGRLGARRVP